jgi:chromosome segregation ATPase
MGKGLARKREASGAPDMVSSENGDLAVQVAELRSDVRHAQRDISDIKIDIRRLDTKFDDVAKTISELKDSLSSARIWALWMYISLASTLLFVVARSAKWL